MNVRNKDAVSYIAKSGIEFNNKLYQEIAKRNKDNTVFSSFSVHSVLCMVLNGAKRETADQIKTHLVLPEDKYLLPGFQDIFSSLNSVEESNIKLKSANRLYIQEGLEVLDEFLKANQTYYLSEPGKVNFSEEENARSEINSWVEGQTDSKIKDLIPAGTINSSTALILVNAIYLKANWSKKFDIKSTNKQDFYMRNGETVKVDMMHKTSKYSFCILDRLDAQAIELPYTEERISMIIVLPNQKDGLDQLQANICELDSTTGLNFEQDVEVSLALPKFKIESNHDLNEPLKQIGLRNMFSTSADFSGITGKRDVFVTKALQKAFIEVNEEGVEAAAATALIMARCSMPFKDAQMFVCDHPFLFMVKDNLTGVILFSGKVMNPKF